MQTSALRWRQPRRRTRWADLYPNEVGSCCLMFRAAQVQAATIDIAVTCRLNRLLRTRVGMCCWGEML